MVGGKPGSEPLLVKKSGIGRLLAEKPGTRAAPFPEKPGTRVRCWPKSLELRLIKSLNESPLVDKYELRLLVEKRGKATPLVTIKKIFRLQ